MPLKPVTQAGMVYCLKQASVFTDPETNNTCWQQHLLEVVCYMCFSEKDKCVNTPTLGTVVEYKQSFSPSLRVNTTVYFGKSVALDSVRLKVGLSKVAFRLNKPTYNIMKVYVGIHLSGSM